MPDQAVPILPSRDLHATLAFYERLGFVNAGAPPDRWDYLIITRNGAQLHFYLDPTVDPLTTPFSCYVYTEDADASMRSGRKSASRRITRRAAGSSRPRTWTTGCVSSPWSTRAAT